MALKRYRREQDLVPVVPTHRQRDLTFIESGEIYPLPTKAVGSAVDLGGRQRVSNTTSLFTNVNALSRNETLWIEDTSGGAETITHDFNRAACALVVGTASGEYALRQSFLRPAYDPGKPNRGQFTFVMPPQKANQGVELGFGDDNNALLLRREDNGVAFVIRSDTSGSPSDANAVFQADWNGDKLDGTGPSKATLDLEARNLFRVSYLWQGVGPAQFGFLINGQYIICHTFYNSNTGTFPYVRTPSMPARYKIYNTGVVPSASTLYEICTDIESEGGHAPPGLKWSFEADVTSRRAITTPQIFFAVRHKATYNGHPNFSTFKILDGGFSTTTNDAVIRLAHFHNVTAVTATWQDVDTTASGLEFSTDISSITATHTHLFDHQFLETGVGNKASGAELDTESFDGHSTISQNLDASASQVFGFIGYAEAGTANLWAHMTGREFT